MDGCGCDKVKACNPCNPTSPKCGNKGNLICGLNIQNINNMFSPVSRLGK